MIQFIKMEMQLYNYFYNIEENKYINILKMKYP